VTAFDEIEVGLADGGLAVSISYHSSLRHQWAQRGGGGSGGRRYNADAAIILSRPASEYVPLELAMNCTMPCPAGRSTVIDHIEDARGLLRD
jgi:hypothetical protein